MKELDSCHYKQQASMQTELKKEMGLLQKKLLMETVKSTVCIARGSLHCMCVCVCTVAKPGDL